MDFEEENLCSICLEDMQLYPKLKLNCNHYFHFYCINLWQKRSNICPICRKSIIIFKEKKYKSCLSLSEIVLLISFIILFFSFFIFMILKSVERLKLKKKAKLINRPKYKYKNLKYKILFDLIEAKSGERMKILKEYINSFPFLIKNKIENFFDDIVEGYQEFVVAINELNQMWQKWKNK